MKHTDPRTDAYISTSAPFAQPILAHLRELIHKNCPEVTETIKWGMPYFTYQGTNLCSFAAFKQHCAFIFWKGKEMEDTDNIFKRGEDEKAMGHLGKIEKLKDLPADKIMGKYIKAAAILNESPAKAANKEKITATPKRELEIPDYFLAALKKNKQALAIFNAFSYSNKKEYVEWVTGAKTATTREERLNTAVAWMAEGKIRNWKYVK
ncbi:YdeI/OmpD-associated family protein [Chitinophaga solisilvae]|uniref:YdeI/OmpD-associated family protein n=1 Tax=Chitinophaga solisilvae TaxID=1233460 RepID=UPI00136C92E1|nr:DUF1801 domain-containing protein [Chitinophaga solisilvae]